MLQRDPGPGPDAVAWTDADLALLDEARAVLGPPRRQPSDDDRPRSYGHIVVDEAQELSPMQLRMLGRRSLSGSMTIVGDVAQATGEWAPGSWDEVLAHLPSHKGNRITELTVNYRTPSEIMELAGRVLAVAAPGMSAPEAVRTTGVSALAAPGRRGPPGPGGGPGGSRRVGRGVRRDRRPGAGWPSSARPRRWMR